MNEKNDQNKSVLSQIFTFTNAMYVLVGTFVVMQFGKATLILKAIGMGMNEDKKEKGYYNVYLPTGEPVKVYFDGKKMPIFGNIASITGIATDLMVNAFSFPTKINLPSDTGIITIDKKNSNNEIHPSSFNFCEHMTNLPSKYKYRLFSVLATILMHDNTSCRANVEAFD